MKRRNMSKGGRNRVEIKWVYRFMDSTSEETSIRDLNIGIMNRIYKNETTMIVSRCNILGIKFREYDDIVIREICDATEGN